MLPFYTARTAHWAEAYTPEFCRAVARGLRRQLEHDLENAAFVDGESEDLGPDKDSEADAEAPDDEDQDEQGADRDSGKEDENAEPTLGERALLQQAHEKWAHPRMRDFVRCLRLGRCKPHLVQWARKHFKCPACDSRVRPKPRRVSAIPKSFRLNHVVGIDLIFLPVPGKDRAAPYLTCACWGTHYQTIQKVPKGKKDRDAVWKAFVRSWRRFFGTPEIIVADPGKAFMGKFIERAGRDGSLVSTTDGRSPWKNAKAERHGGMFKEMHRKACELEPPTTKEEMEVLTLECESAANRYLNRAGASPAQRVLGQSPRLPGTLLSDDIFDPLLLTQDSESELMRAAKLRHAAQKGFMEINSVDALRRFLKGKLRHRAHVNTGDWVRVWRKFTKDIGRLGSRLHEGSLGRAVCRPARQGRDRVGRASSGSAAKSRCAWPPTKRRWARSC